MFVGFVMSSPPVYITGMNDEKALHAAPKAFGVAALYAATFIFALFMANYRAKREKQRDDDEKSISDRRDRNDSNSMVEPLVRNGESTEVEMSSLTGKQRSKEEDKKKKKKKKGISPE